jgi:hypothetical protein
MDKILFNDSQIVPEPVIQTYPLFNDSQILPERVLPPRTWVTLCRVHNMVLDDVHNMAHLINHYYCTKLQLNASLSHLVI